MDYTTGYREMVLSSRDERGGRRAASRPGRRARAPRVPRDPRRVGGTPLRNGVLALLMLATGTAVFAERMSGGDEITSAIERTVLYHPQMTLNGERFGAAHARAARDEVIRAKVERFRAYRLTPELAGTIYDRAVEHDIDPDIAFGLVRAESSFRNHATSPVGAVGLAQLMPRTASWMVPGTTIRDLRDPRTNLDIGFKYLRYLLDKYDGNEDLALLAYNRGPGTVDRALRRGANPDNGYAAFVRGEQNHGHRLFTR